MEKLKLAAFNKIRSINHITKFSILVISVLFFTSCSNTKPAAVIKNENQNQPSILEKKISENNYVWSLPSSASPEGGLFFTKITFEDLDIFNSVKEINLQFLNRNIKLYPEINDEKQQYVGIIGLEFGVEAGMHPIELNICFENKSEKKCLKNKSEILVSKTEFPTEKLKVPPRSVSPSKKDMVRIKKEQIIINQAYASSENKKYWQSPIELPVHDIITSKYGSHRMYNGNVSGVHYGTDFRAPTGTPIHAPLEGKVVIAHNLFFTGWTVILDHGFDFFTIYGHMSELKVKNGAVLKKGELIGLSGATGRASGPHLHWGIKLHGVKIDPLAIVEALK